MIWNNTSAQRKRLQPTSKCFSLQHTVRRQGFTDELLYMCGGTHKHHLAHRGTLSQEPQCLAHMWATWRAHHATVNATLMSTEIVTFNVNAKHAFGRVFNTVTQRQRCDTRRSCLRPNKKSNSEFAPTAVLEFSSQCSKAARRQSKK